MNLRLLLLASLLLTACAKSADRAPLPGDSVVDGSVNLNPGRVPVAPAAPAPARDAPSALEAKLFPPELVMENQAAIGLTPVQKDAIVKDVDKTHSELLKLQWELDTEKEKLIAILDKPQVEEAKSKQAAAEVMKREDAIKAGHLAMLVRIKNTLTAEQHTKLQHLREASRCGSVDAGR